MLVDRLELRSHFREYAPCDRRPAVLSRPEAGLLLETCTVTLDVPYGSIVLYHWGLLLEFGKDIDNCFVPL